METEKDTKGTIIIISGPPGAGKTTITEELVTISKAPLSCIEGDVFWSFIAKGKEYPARGENFRTLMRAMTLTTTAYARDGYDVVLDFSMPPAFLERAMEKRLKEFDVRYIVLRPDKEICAKRAFEREKGAIKDYSDFHALYELFDSAQEYIINDESDPKTVAQRIRTELDAGKFVFRRSNNNAM